MQAVAWNRQYQKFRELGYGVTIVTFDDVSVHARFAERENIAFTLLADKDSAIIKAFDMANPQYPEGSGWHGVALPGIFVIGRDGVVTHRYMTEGYRDRPSVDAVYTVLQKSAAGG